MPVHRSSNGRAMVLVFPEFGATRFFGAMLVAAALFALMAAPLSAATDETTDELSRSTAVALNYCRTSFHRIRKYPSKHVMIQEQQKILNNLNLNQIADEEVVRLYTAVLDEICQIEVADKDKKIIHKSHERILYRQLAISAFQFSTQMATAEYGEAIRTGVRSWWDYRGHVFSRDLEKWNIDKTRMAGVVDKSSLFLDTFWKLARKRNIPDRWLVRSSDLDELEEAMRERDCVVRLRVLKRMENFMECYPPYWYYVGRTQQALGQLFAAEKTYAKLIEVGGGHFRRDEMLAAGAANQAVIQDYLQQRSAPETAAESLTYSTDVWEVNLVSARVLQRHDRVDEAEDAVLRNLDTDLERRQSLVCLLSLYYHSGNVRSLSERLSDAEVVRTIPADVLLQCAALLGREKLPGVAAYQISASLYGRPDRNFGRDEFVVRASGNWRLHTAEAKLVMGNRVLVQPRLSNSKGNFELRFRGVSENSRSAKLDAGHERPIILVLTYPGAREFRMALGPLPSPDAGSREGLVGSVDPTKMLVSLLRPLRNDFRIASVSVQKQHLLLAGAAPGANQQSKAEAPPARDKTVPVEPVPVEPATIGQSDVELTGSEPAIAEEPMPIQ